VIIDVQNSTELRGKLGDFKGNRKAVGGIWQEENPKRIRTLPREIVILSRFVQQLSRE
jgi:hypothetical protein